MKTRKSIPSLMRVALFAPLFTVPFLLAGCGSAGSSVGAGGAGSPLTKTADTGRAIVTIAWPAKHASSGRLIPEAADMVQVSVGIIVNGTNNLIQTQTATPSGGAVSTLTFNGLPIGNLTLTATAYPGNATTPGVADATGTMTVTTSAAQPATPTLTMGSTIDHLSLTPATSTITSGASETLTVTAYNGPNEATAGVVLLSEDQLQWSGNSTAFGQVSTLNDTITGTAASAGTATVTVTDAESGKTASATVNVQIGVSISPTAYTMSVNDTTQFTAAVVGSSNTAVTWSVLEGSSGGTIDASGNYTAPATRGTYHVVATSVADTTKSATAVVTVQSGNATGSIN